jgi:glutaryl-CoA dehydrogenase
MDPITLDALGGWTASLSPEETMVRESTRRWVNENWMPQVAEHFEAGTFPLEVARGLGRLGLLGASLTGYGCAGMSNVAYGVAMHALEWGDSGLRSFASVQGSLAMYAIHRFGSPEQKERWLPAMAQGQVIGCFGLTEPDSGSDPGSMRTQARPAGGDWVLNGEKMWITNSPAADVAVVWAKTGPNSDDIRGFLVERGTPGLSAPELHHKMSMRASLTGGLVLQDVRVPDSHRLPGAVGLGSALSCLNNARFGVAFGVMGAARFCLERAIGYARERRQFGVPIARKQLIQGQLADMAQQLVLGELVALHVARLKDANQLTPFQVSLAKRNNCAAALEVARKCRHSGSQRHRWITVIRHAVNLESTYTYEGTNEVHALILGRGLTGEDAF